MTAPLLFLGHAADRTGPPVYLLHLLRWLRRNQPDVEFEIALLSGGPLEEEFRSLAQTTVYAGHGSSRWESAERAVLRRRLDVADWWWATRRSQQLQRQMEEHADARVVYVNSAPSIELARHLPPGDRIMLSHVHELEIGLTHRCSPKDRHLLLEGARQIFVPSEAVRENLIERHRIDRAVISHHPEMIDVGAGNDTARDAEAGGTARARARERRGLPSEGLIVGSCGTIDWRKAVDLFLGMAWRLTTRNKGERVTFVWVGGDGRAIAKATQEAAAMGIGDSVRFVGIQHDPIDWFRLMDVFVLPAREDPFPLVCLEAASVRCPIVAFDNGGMPELLVQGCGFVASYPDVNELAEKVARLLDDPVLRRSMGERGRNLMCSNYDVSVLAPRLWADVEGWLP